MDWCVTVKLHHFHDGEALASASQYPEIPSRGASVFAGRRCDTAMKPTMGSSYWPCTIEQLPASASSGPPISPIMMDGIGIGVVVGHHVDVLKTVDRSLINAYGAGLSCTSSVGLRHSFVGSVPESGTRRQFGPCGGCDQA